MVPVMIPNTEIAEIILIIFCFFFETRYRRAINSGKFKTAKFIEVFISGMDQFVNVINIIEAVVDKKL